MFWEWCLDDWHDSYQGKPDHLKSNGNEPWGAMNINKYDNCYHLLRGGSWNYNVRECRTANRNWFAARNLNEYCAGFRVVFAYFP